MFNLTSSISNQTDTLAEIEPFYKIMRKIIRAS